MDWNQVDLENMADEWEEQQEVLDEMEEEESDRLTFAEAWRDGFDDIYDQMER